MKFVRMLNDQGIPYSSYGTLQTLVEVSGIPWIDQTEMDIEANEDFLLPMVNGNSLAWARDSRRKSRLIAWNLERNLHGYETFAPTCFDRLWVGDHYHAAMLGHRKDVQYVPVGGHPDLGKPKAEVKWDLAAFCYTYGRRERIINGIRDQGFTIAPNAFSPERDAILSACRAGLSVHQHDNDPAINELRMVLFACNRLPLVCEYVRDPFPYQYYGLNQIKSALNDNQGYAETNYKVMTEQFEFRKVIEEACKA